MADAKQESQGQGAIRPTLFLGLGGTGKEILLRLRRKFFERFRLPSLPCTSFLWIDTDTRDVDARGERLDEVYQAVRFTEDERAGLLVGQVRQDLGDIFRSPSQYPHIHSWLQKEVERYGQEIQDGAGGVRSVGRLCFFNRYGAGLKSTIEASVTRLKGHGVINDTRELFDRWKLPQPQFSSTPQVFVVSSVAGGTGGGILLDTAFFLRSLQVESIFGIVALPNIYYADRDSEVARRSFGNGYASLKEIEYYTLRMSTEESKKLGIDYNVQWEKGSSQPPIPGPPFSTLYLLERSNESDHALEISHRPELFRMIADTLFLDFIPGNFSTEKRSHYSNVAQVLSAAEDAQVEVNEGQFKLPQRFARRYASFGMSKVEIPMDAIRAACSAKLAADVLEYINRPAGDSNVKGNLQDDFAQKGLNGRGIVAKFGTAWSDTIQKRVDDLFRGRTLANDTEIDQMTADLAALEEELVRSERDDPRFWGTLIGDLRGKTQGITKDVKAGLRTWLRETLDNPKRGLSAVIQENGYLALGIGVLQALCESPESNRRAEFDQRIEAGEQDLRYYTDRQKTTLTYLRAAARSPTIGMLLLRASTRDILRDRLQEDVTQLLKARAEACLMREAKKVAKAGYDYLASFRRVLNESRAATAQMASELDGQHKKLLEFGKPILSIRVYDPEDFHDKYYKLGRDADGGYKVVDPHAELALMMEGILDSGEGTLELLERCEMQGPEELRKDLRHYTDDRFLGDFAENPRAVDVLANRDIWKDKDTVAHDLVRFALPLLRQTQNLAGYARQPERAAYIGVSNMANPRAREFTELVKAKLKAMTQLKDEEIRVLQTETPSEFYLYTVKYAFPLPLAKTVTTECDAAYQEFYQRMGRTTSVDEKTGIGLHLSKLWEGRFEDLVSHTDHSANAMRESLQALLLGAVLKTVDIAWDSEREHFEYTYMLGEPLFTRVTLGAKPQARKMLAQDNTTRQMLHQAFLDRKRTLTDEDLKTYYWTLQYLRFRGGDLLTGLDQAVVTNELMSVQDTIRQRKVEIDLAGIDNNSKSAAERAEIASQQLEGRVDKIGDPVRGQFLTLKSQALWAKGNAA